MDDNNQNPKSQVPNIQQGNAQQPSVAVTTPAGKESATVTIPKPQEKWIEESVPAVEISKELKEAGVEAPREEVFEIPEQVSQAGVMPSGTATPIPQEPEVNFPLTEEKAIGIIKLHKKIKESITWLAMLVLRQFKIIKFKKQKS